MNNGYISKIESFFIKYSINTNLIFGDDYWLKVFLEKSKKYNLKKINKNYTSIFSLKNNLTILATKKIHYSIFK